MSMEICERCSASIDTDFDVECYVENPANPDDVLVLCPSCRDDLAWDLDLGPSEERD